MSQEVKILMKLHLTWVLFTRSWCVAFCYEKHQSFLFWRTYCHWWKVPSYDREDCLVSHSCMNSFSVRLCINKLLPSRSCLSKQGVSWFLYRKSWPNSFGSCSTDFSPLHFLFGKFIKDSDYWEKVQNVNELHERTVRVWMCVNNEMLTSTRWELEYGLEVFCATNGEHIQIYIYLAHKKLAEIQCFKMYQFLLHS
jgi:hypothetical protein